MHSHCSQVPVASSQKSSQPSDSAGSQHHILLDAIASKPSSSARSKKKKEPKIEGKRKILPGGTDAPHQAEIIPWQPSLFYHMLASHGHLKLCSDHMHSISQVQDVHM